MKYIRGLIIGMVALISLTACTSTGDPEVLKGNKTKFLNLGSLIAVSGDTYNITESSGTDIGYRVRLK